MPLENNVEDNNQFESGYSEEPAAVPEPKKEPENKQAEKKVDEPEAVDPIKALMERFDKLEARTRNAEGHIGGLNHQQKLLQESIQAASKAATKQVTDAPTKEQVSEALKNPQEWEDLKLAFPEWATATEKFMEAKLASIKPEAPALTPEQVEKKIADVIERVTDTSLNAVFPGWRKEVATPEFDAWLNSQPDDVKALAGSDDVGDAARMLKLYDLSKQAKVKQEAPPKKEPSAREKQLKAAINPKGTGGHAAGRSEVDEFESGYNS